MKKIFFLIAFCLIFSFNLTSQKIFVNGLGSYGLIVGGNGYTESQAPLTMSRFGGGLGVDYIIAEKFSIGVSGEYAVGTRATLYSKPAEDHDKTLTGDNGLIIVSLKGNYFMSEEAYRGIGFGFVFSYAKANSIAVQSSSDVMINFSYWNKIGDKFAIGLINNIGYSLVDKKSQAFLDVDNITGIPQTFIYETGNANGFIYKPQLIVGYLF